MFGLFSSTPQVVPTPPPKPVQTVPSALQQMYPQKHSSVQYFMTRPRDASTWRQVYKNAPNQGFGIDIYSHPDVSVLPPNRLTEGQRSTYAPKMTGDINAELMGGGRPAFFLARRSQGLM